MPKPSTKFAPALLAGILAAANLATVTEVRAQAATDNCLTSPKAATPAGSHWYYRIDRATNRQCWYLREKDDKNARAAPQPAAAPSSTSSAAAPDPAPAKPSALTPKAISDARAQWMSQRARPEADVPAIAEPRTVGAASPPKARDGLAGVGANAVTPAPAAATRWPDVPGIAAAGSSSETLTAAADAPAATSWQSGEPQQPSAAEAAPAADPWVTKPTASLQMLLAVMAAALALAGLTVSLIFRIGRARARAIMRRNRRAMWDSVPARRSPPASLRSEEPRARARRPEGAQHALAVEHRERQVTAMLARLARSGARH
ncbi:hypothetical protein [Bradyrhizobium sp.]|uniref:hypothetical protein n=1 Tax=Bradyrhizobium sp. TaxID=376 RepID=UPI0025BDB39E|nr:hypothetical protein [Bradyrhizobium sp.]